MTGNPIKAYPHFQNHEAYIAAHSGIFTKSEYRSTKSLQRVQAIQAQTSKNINAMLYRLQIEGILAQQGIQLPAMEDGQPMPPEMDEVKLL